MKKIYIFTTNTLNSHVIVDVSELSKNEFQSQIKNKFNLDELTFIYSADFINKATMPITEELALLPANSIKDIPVSLEIFFKKSKSNFGTEIYKANLLEVFDLISDEYLENYEVSDEFKELINKKRRDNETQRNQWYTIKKEEDAFLSQYQSQYDEINDKWSKFWDQKIESFYSLMLNNDIPIEKSSLFFNDRNHQKFKELSQKYVENLCTITEKWREESKALQSYLNIKCRHCNTSNKVIFKLIGPGNTCVYGGNNSNTHTEREYLLKPEYGTKLISGRRYYWRHVSSLEGQCSVCNKSILTNSMGEYQLLQNLSKLKNTNTCAIYPYDDKKSWFEWCGIWMTIFNWSCYEIKSQTHLNSYAYGFFREYRKIYN